MKPKSRSMGLACRLHNHYSGYYAPPERLDGKVFDIMESVFFFYVPGGPTPKCRLGLWRAKDTPSLPDRLDEIYNPGTSPLVLVRDLILTETYR